MKMLWIFYFIAMIIIMLICYITNPIVVLFADEEGELHGFLKYWQTWDDSLDSKFMMTEVVPNKWYGKYLDYKWDTKYEFYQDTETLKEFGHVIDKVRLRPGATFSTKERIQRYFCRVLWLSRNCAYGFAYYLLNANGNIEDLYIKQQNVDSTGELIIAYDKKESILTRPWTLKFYKHIVGPLYIHGYLGWKIPIWHDNGRYNAMLANRLVPRFKPMED